jgi:DNA helicase IV
LLVVQGGPGTGKSIVAAHRAAYLTLPSNEGAPAFKEVLLLGPTQNYVNHEPQPTPAQRQVRTHHCR